MGEGIFLKDTSYIKIFIYHGPRFILQHDSESKHTARVITSYLQQQEEQGVLQQVVWPHRSPTSTSWSQSGITQRHKTLGQYKSTEELWRVLPDTLINLPAKYKLKNCVHCNAHRRTVAKVKGGHSKCWVCFLFNAFCIKCIDKWKLFVACF